MEREDRYVVLKRKEVHMALSKSEREELWDLCAKIARYRADLGKTPLITVVVEADWPEYEPTWRAIEKRMDETPNR